LEGGAVCGRALGCGERYIEKSLGALAGPLQTPRRPCQRRLGAAIAAELADRLTQGPVGFDLDVQLAGAGDPIDDPTAPWPDDREVVRIGRLEISAPAHDREVGGDVLVFDPTHVPDGIVLSRDPILLARPGAYSVSVARRTASVSTR